MTLTAYWKAATNPFLKSLSTISMKKYGCNIYKTKNPSESI